MVPLRTRLRNGDIVEIVTNTGHKPSRDWLNFVVTSRARNKIKHFVQEEERARSIELGRRLLEKEARRVDLNPGTFFESEVFKKLAADYGPGDELFAEIGYGKVQPRKVMARLVPAGADWRSPPRRLRRRWRAARPSPGDDKIKVRGIDDLMVVRARCCNPIRGENIVGLHHARERGVRALRRPARTSRTCSTIPSAASTSNGTRPPMHHATSSA